jgi:FkbM family methyltransferase
LAAADPLSLNETPPHPALTRFTPWHGIPEADCQVNFLGVQTSIEYFDGMDATPQVDVQTEYPPTDEEDIFEWIDLLESVTGSDTVFTMVELGAGWGRWIANAAAACKQIGREYRLIGVEAEPTHFEWMREHLARNHVDAQLIAAAVAGHTGMVRFRTGAPADCYGQRILRSWREQLDWRRTWGGRTRRVRAVDLATVFDDARLDVVDLIDLDVQSAEAAVLEPAASLLDERVRRVHIGTHPGENEERLRILFNGLGWRCVRDFPWGHSSETEFGRIDFQDGVQTWVNPRL